MQRPECAAALGAGGLWVTAADIISSDSLPAFTRMYWVHMLPLVAREGGATHAMLSAGVVEALLKAAAGTQSTRGGDGGAQSGDSARVAVLAARAAEVMLEAADASDAQSAGEDDVSAELSAVARVVGFSSALGDAAVAEAIQEVSRPASAGNVGSDSDELAIRAVRTAFYLLFRA